MSSASSHGFNLYPITHLLACRCQSARLEAYLGGRVQFGNDKHCWCYTTVVKLSVQNLVGHTLKKGDLGLNSGSSHLHIALIHPLSYTGQQQFQLQLPTNRISRTQLGNLNIRISQAVRLFFLRKFRNKY